MKVEIEEMPQGCVLSQYGTTIVVSSPEDAIAIINSLVKMLKIQFSDVVEFQELVLQNP